MGKLRRLDNPDPIYKVAHLVDIYEKRLEDQERFYDACWDTFGFPVMCVSVPHTSYLLMRCISMVRGPMAAGNWLDLGLHIFDDRSLSPNQTVFSNPFFPRSVFLENAVPIRWPVTVIIPEGIKCETLQK